MANEQDYQAFLDRIAALRETVTDRLSAQLVADPQLADVLTKQIDDLLRSAVKADLEQPPPPDKGLAQLVGIGDQAADALGKTRLPQAIEPYDETVSSERLVAMADLYYIYQHEMIGVFRAVQKLQELFRAGAVYLSSGAGAYALYQFDRREVLRYTRRDRLAAYRRAFGYGRAPVPAGSRANSDYHGLFEHFVNQVALFHRDKRIADVVRERAYDPSFGSIAVVRRAGLDLRNNLKFTSYGHVNVLRVEVMQLLDEAYRILGSDDIKRLYGADTAWDVVEIVLAQYFGERLVTSPRQRMAIAGREVLRWLAQPHLLQTQRAKFETLLLEIAESAEEWLTSAQSLGVAERQEDRRGMPWDRSAAPAAGARRVTRPRPPAPPASRGTGPAGGTRGRGPAHLNGARV
ncbi:hypothetical protein ABZT17_18060 [Streptomyces sp. NPDC005648]|uniref:hypothetical protein n=1 Tax=Streptomyces sp. NPDC005648 TaxID=3157044 RepID=UPI0033BF0722